MAKDEQVPAETESGGGKKKLFIIIGAAVAVAVILGVVVFLMMGKGDKKDAKKEGAEAQTEAKADAKAEGGGHGGGGKEGGKEGASNIYPLEPFIVNIYDGQELRYLKVKVEMEMAGAGMKSEMDARLAPMRDAILVLLSTKTMQDIQDIQGKNQLKDEILAAVNKQISSGKIAKVYFTDFVVQ